MDRLELRSQDGKAKSMGASIQGHRDTDLAVDRAPEWKQQCPWCGGQAWVVAWAFCAPNS